MSRGCPILSPCCFVNVWVVTTIGGIKKGKKKGKERENKATGKENKATGKENKT